MTHAVALRHFTDSNLHSFECDLGGCKRPTVVCLRTVSMPTSWRQGGGGAPVLRPTLAGGRSRLQSAAASTPLCPASMGGNRESGLRPGAPPPPCASGVACHAVACHPGAGAGGLGYGRRHHSRWPRPAQEQTVLMARRRRTKNGAPRAWAGERAPGHLPLLHACTQPAANLGNCPPTACRRRRCAGRSPWGFAFWWRTL